jgi:hypothetical protein
MEAARTGSGLRVIHVLPDYAPNAYPLPPAEIVSSGREVLKSVVERVSPTDSGVEVEQVLRRGSRVSALVSYSRAARLLVVGADRRPECVALLTPEAHAEPGLEEPAI